MFRLVTSLMIAAFAASAAVAAPTEADAMLTQLSKIRLDKKQIYTVRDITLNRDVLSISLNRGAVAFTEALDGRVTGAVFIGSGDILAIPPDRIEKQQLFRFTRSALLNEHFETAIFRFSDSTYQEILKEIRSHASEAVDADVTEELLRWESEMQRRATYLNGRILADLLGPPGHPFFLAQIEGAELGWFDAIYDERRVEEVLIQQFRASSGIPAIWANFHKRSEVREPERVAHEDKSLFEIVSANSDVTSVRLKLKADGERVIELPLVGASVSKVSLQSGPSLVFSEGREGLDVVLPEPSRTGTEVTLDLEYKAEGSPESRSAFRSRADAIAPASYRDQWIIDGLTKFGAATTDPRVLSDARSLLLSVSPEGGTYDSIGPAWIGYRMIQPGNTSGYAGGLSSKSAWIIYMLKNVVQASGGESAYTKFVDDIRTEFLGKSISTFDVKRLAEKHALKPLDWFFESWVFGTGIPAYTIDYKVDAAAGGFSVSGKISQTGVPDTFEMPVPLYADDALLGAVNVSSDGGEFRFLTRTRPQQLRIDPMRTILTHLPGV